MRVVLGPMEGVLDHLMRDILTDVNDYDLCVTEFVRVVNQCLPSRVFYRLCPELNNGAKTRAGVPVNVQLLGQEPHWMAENTFKAYELGAKGIDLNFGCPAKTVNRSKGGAALLENPELIYRVVKACRDAVPAEITVSAKIRLGIENPDDCFEIVNAIESAGASELTVHARTKNDGYQADKIKWEYIRQIKDRTTLPIIANGEIWNYTDGQACIETTGIDSLMVCRGAFNVPNLGNVVKHNAPPMPWHEVVRLLSIYSHADVVGDKAKYYPSRIKQWLSYLRRAYPQAQDLFAQIRTQTQVEPIIHIVDSHHHRLNH